jgi:hypothetical protein
MILQLYFVDTEVFLPCYKTIETLGPPGFPRLKTCRGALAPVIQFERRIHRHGKALMPISANGSPDFVLTGGMLEQPFTSSHELHGGAGARANIMRQKIFLRLHCELCVEVRWTYTKNWCPRHLSMTILRNYGVRRTFSQQIPSSNGSQKIIRKF